MADPGFTGPIVIVGAGLAGGKAAVTLREEGYRGRLLLIATSLAFPSAARLSRRPTFAARRISPAGL